MLWTKAKIAIGCVLVLGSLGLGGSVLLHETSPAPVAAAPPAAAPQARASKPADKVAGSKAQEKRYAFEVRNKRWADVFEWLSEQAGIPVISPNLPTGTFTFIPPASADKAKRTYTLSEIIDFINEGLLANGATQRYLLIRRPASFTLLPADEKIDPTLLPQVAPGDLDKRGKTELVRVMLPLVSLDGKDVAPEVKKMMGPFGEAIPVGFSNSLLLQDTAGNLVRIREAIQGADRQKRDKKN